MAYEMKEHTGSLFKNDRKLTANHPDYVGSVMVGGHERFLSAWVKESKKGTKYISVSIGLVKERQGFREAGADELPKQSAPVIDDDLPF